MNSKLQNFSDRELLETIFDEMVCLKNIVGSFPQWIPLYIISDEMDMSYRNMFRRVVESGLYEEGNHYKKIDGDVCVNKSIIHTLKRKRKHKKGLR